MAIEVLISSPPDREYLVAEVIVDDHQLAEVNREAGKLEIEIYPREDGQPWTLDYQKLVDALGKAGQALEQRYGS